ncbi:hypothetical protein [Phormidesmis priestleyi]|uniref:hypothetical protein n=1 Tax=Phormidesmis priestleyi TaxID=268141 RepID=UPI000AA4B7B1|nr:hypothetical protein [Phormidesmis priestleyi]
MLQDNWLWLEDYIGVEVPSLSPTALKALQEQLQQMPGICLSELVTTQLKRV